MTAALGFGTVAVFLALTFSRRVSVLVALVVVPTVAALIGSFAGDLDKYMADGLADVAPVGILIMFAVFYFTLMIDVGLFDPIIKAVLRAVKGDPAKIAVGTVVLTVLVALDGDGASTFLITVSAMLPLYKRVGMSPLVLAGTVALGAGVMNMIPWGGPTARAMAALDLESSEVFLPVLPAMIAGIAWALFAAYIIGRKERQRIGVAEIDTSTIDPTLDREMRRPTPVLIFDAVLTVALLVALVVELLPLEVLFVIAFAIALLVNCPNWEDQQRQIEKHGKSAALVTAMIFAAGIFTGVLTGTKMVDEMAQSAVSIVPEGLGGALPVLVAVVSMPLSLVFTPDAYYFGVLPVLGQTAEQLGMDPALMARASILGQMTTGFPLSPLTASTFILLGMAGVDLGSHQRFIFKWAFGSTLVMTAVALATGALT